MIIIQNYLNFFSSSTIYTSVFGYRLRCFSLSTPVKHNIIVRSTMKNVITKIVKKASGLCDVNPNIRSVLNGSSGDISQQLALKRLHSHLMFYSSYTLFSKPIKSVNELYSRLNFLATHRPFNIKPICHYEDHLHSYQYYNPFMQNFIAGVFANFGYDFDDLSEAPLLFDISSYNTVKKTPIAITTLTEIALLENAHRLLLTKNPNVKGILINPDNFNNPQLQSQAYSIMGQPRPDSMLSMTYMSLASSAKEKIAFSDVKLIKEPERFLSCTKGLVSVSPMMNKILFMKRFMGDIGTLINHKFINDKDNPEAILLKNWKKEIDEILIDKSLILDNKFKKFENLNRDFLLNPILNVVVPTIIIDMVPEQNFIDFVNKNFSKEDYLQFLDDISIIIDHNILLPTQANGVDVGAFDNMLMDIFKKLPKSIQYDVINNYHNVKTLLITL
jgi:hypothetical protein